MKISPAASSSAKATPPKTSGAMVDMSGREPERIDAPWIEKMRVLTRGCMPRSLNPSQQMKRRIISEAHAPDRRKCDSILLDVSTGAVEIRFGMAVEQAQIETGVP